MPKLAAVLLLLGLAFESARLTWGVLAPPPAPVPFDAGTEAPERRAVADDAALKLAQAGLFGHADAPAASEALPKTRLSLTLHGVLSYDQDEGGGVAIISGGGKGERPYRVGDALPGGATLKAVQARRVLLELGGRTEVLELPKLAISGAVARPAGAPSAPSGLDGGTRERLLANPAELMKLIRAEPHRVDGRLAGYRIRPGQQPELFAALGFMPDDVILGIDNHPVTDSAAMARMMQDLRDASAVTVTVLRDGVETPVLVQMN
jgi:general secretion pathway protein C